MSVKHANEEGDIVAVGKNENKRFFKVKFADGAEEWLSEDQVFNEVSGTRPNQGLYEFYKKQT